jgi:hypothetical protein
MKNQHYEDSNIKMTQDALKFKLHEEFEEYKLSDEFFDKLHDEIMEKVAQVEIEYEPAISNSEKRLNSNWRSWIISAGGLLSLVFVVSRIFQILCVISVLLNSMVSISKESAKRHQLEEFFIWNLSDAMKVSSNEEK